MNGPHIRRVVAEHDDVNWLDSHLSGIVFLRAQQPVGNHLKYLVNNFEAVGVGRRSHEVENDNTDRVLDLLAEHMQIVLLAHVLHDDGIELEGEVLGNVLC